MSGGGGVRSGEKDPIWRVRVDMNEECYCENAKKEFKIGGGEVGDGSGLGGGVRSWGCQGGCE